MPQSTSIRRAKTPAVEKLHAGMPPLDASADKLSVFEFWPMAIFYLPVIVYILWLMLRYRGVMLPTCANPDLPYSGLVGESKTEVLDQMSGDGRGTIAPYMRIRRTGDSAATVQALTDAMDRLKLDFPVVLKPDIGMRGAGVQVAASHGDLWRYVDLFPEGSDIVIQYLIPHDGEAGVFYVRRPCETQGQITSLTLKYFPKVVGDGQTPLRDLIAATPRAGKVMHLYAQRFADRLDDVVPAGQSIRLAFAGNHSKGTIFRNGNAYISAAMTARFDALARDMGEFYIGRFDVRFDDWGQFVDGQDFTVLEVNGVGGEATHIWDSRMLLRDAWAAVMAQYRWAYEIGAWNKRRGFRPTRPLDLYRAWRHEIEITRHYPTTH